MFLCYSYNLPGPQLFGGLLLLPRVPYQMEAFFYEQKKLEGTSEATGMTRCLKVVCGMTLL